MKTIAALGFFLLLAQVSACCFEITLFPAAKAYNQEVRVLHKNLGLEDEDFTVEDFEDDELIAGLSVRVTIRDDPGARPSVWDGSKGGDIQADGDFKISLPDVFLFGIGIGDNDGGSEIVAINCGAPFNLQRLPGHSINGQGRAYYLIIKAEPDDPKITHVRIKGYTIMCDHLLLQQEDTDPNGPFQLVLELRDGSRVIGSSILKSLALQSSGVSIGLPLERIARIELDAEKRTVMLALRNRDKIGGTLAINVWTVSASGGDRSIEMDKIKSITIRRARASMPKNPKH